MPTKHTGEERCPQYKLGDVVLFKGWLGYTQQGYVRAATYFNEDSVFGEGWRYYISARPNGWFIFHRDIIDKLL